MTNVWPCARTRSRPSDLRRAVSQEMRTSRGARRVRRIQVTTPGPNHDPQEIRYFLRDLPARIPSCR